MVALLVAMLLVVVLYYTWKPWADVLARYAEWQHSLGLVGAAIGAGVAGGILSELSFVYIQHRGRWTVASLENMAFKFAFFVLSGGLVYEFYHLQAYWFGDSTAWSVIVKKVLVDQFGYTFAVSMWLSTFATRWQLNCYSFTALRRELDGSFFMERMLPVVIANWMFWLPAVSLIYSVPLILQTPMFLFGTAIWGLLLSAVSREGHKEEIEQAAMVAGPVALPDVE